MHLPVPRGPLTDSLCNVLRNGTGGFADASRADVDCLVDDDFQLALYICYELHYRSFEDVDDRWEWDPSLLAFRRTLEDEFERALRARTGRVECPPDAVARELWAALEAAPPTMSRYIERNATLAQFVEFVVHRSVYHLREADPHTWAIPRLSGRPKAALVEIQMDEYGSGLVHRMHSTLFAGTMQALGLDSTYGAHVERVPGVTLATVNLMSFFGLHRRLRAALVGHLAAFEMASSVPNRRYAAGARRLGAGDAAPFFDEHVEADSLHEQIAANDMAGSLASDEPSSAAEILFGARALVALDELWSNHVLAAWRRGASSLLVPAAAQSRA
jgi:Iron-containing redox enzyme